MSSVASCSRSSFAVRRSFHQQKWNRQVRVRATESSRTSTEAQANTDANDKKDVLISNGSVDCVGEGQSVVCTVPHRDGVDVSSAEAQATNGSSPSVERRSSDETFLSEALGLLLLISPFFFWGTAMVAMKLAAPHSTPLFTASVRLIPAGAVVVAWALARGKQSPNTAAAWLACIAFGIVDGTLFQGFLAEGLQRVPAGVGSVIIDSQPLTVAVVAALVFGESITPLGVFGLLLGVAGLLLLELPEDQLALLSQLDFGSLGTGFDGAWWDNGQLLMLIAAQCMAAGTLMVPAVTRYVDPVMATGWHMILGGLPLIALSVATEQPELSTNLSQITPSDIGALAYTSLLGSAASYAVFFYYASKGNLARLSSLTFLTPIFASVAGFLLLDEQLNGMQLGGAALTLTGIILMNRKSGDSSETSK